MLRIFRGRGGSATSIGRRGCRLISRWWGWWRRVRSGVPGRDRCSGFVVVVSDELPRWDAVGVGGVVVGQLGGDAGGVRQTPPSGELARDMWGGGFHSRGRIPFKGADSIRGGRMRLGGGGVVEVGSFWASLGVGLFLPPPLDVIDVADSSWSWRISYIDRTTLPTHPRLTRGAAYLQRSRREGPPRSATGCPRL